MKKITIVSVTLASLLFATTMLSANEKSAMHDSVAQKEKAAMSNPKMTDGGHAAKAKIEEEQEKRNFDTKMDREKFKEDAKKDEKKLNGENKAEIKTIEAEDKK